MYPIRSFWEDFRLVNVKDREAKGIFMIGFFLHVSGGDFWEEFWGIATDPAHLMFELVFSIFFDVLIVSVIYGILIKKFLIPKLRKDIHKEIDREHGFGDHE